MNLITKHGNQYQVFETVWQGIQIEIRHCPNWLTSKVVGFQTDHIEIESTNRQKLPITETGYKSNFVDPFIIQQAGSVTALVLGWLNETSNTKAWKYYVETSRQGSLF